MVVCLQIPLLEMTSAWAIARATCHAPSGAAASRRAITGAKAVAVHQGAASALIRLLQLALGRYMAYASGQVVLPHSSALSMTDADASEFTRDMANMDGVLDTLFFACAALLNLSTIKVNQLVLARLGLATLLGAAGVLAATALREQQLADPRQAAASDMLAATITNVAKHPQNRTRLYKAELRGSVALQQELLGQAEGPHAPMPPVPPIPKGEAWRPRTYVRAGRTDAGALIATDVIQRIRPKALFPPLTKPPPAPAVLPEGGQGPTEQSTAKVTAMPSGDLTVTRLFHAWVDDTFQGVKEVADVGETHAKQFRMVDPNTGAWRNEREGLPTLIAALRRPVAHLWDDCLTACAAHGKARWAPAISEYRQAAPFAPGSAAPLNTVMGAVKAQLLYVDAPRSCQHDLNNAAQQLHATGRVDLGLPLEHTRPSTSQRSGGRLPLAVLTPAVQGETILPLPEQTKSVCQRPACVVM
jgi:hypothetical protein